MKSTSCHKNIESQGETFVHASEVNGFSVRIGSSVVKDVAGYERTWVVTHWHE